MTNNKGNQRKKNNKAEAAQPLAVEIGTAERTVLAFGQGIVVRGTIGELTHMGRQLAQRAREGGEERERSTLAAVVAACDVADAAVLHNAGRDLPGVREQYADVLVQATTIKATVLRWAAGKTPLAEAAAEVERELFPETENFGWYDQRALQRTVAWKAQQLAQDESLRATLARVVPEEATAALFAANDAFGAQLAKLREDRVEPIDVGPIVAMLQARIQRYVAAVVAAVEPADEAAVRDAEWAVQPLAELRAEQLAHRRKLIAARARGAAGARAKAAPTPSDAAPGTPPDGSDDDSG